MTDISDKQSLDDFFASHVKPYDPTTDDYDRPPFAADIKEGKNDPIYNAHSYHTKVPPRSIIPYILHYTKPGDLILDPFCGSGMTGVAAQMCANPPKDLLEQFPELKDRIGTRGCILNDLSPAACHIAYNYNTPVDVEVLKCEFERIKAAVKEDFDWLYGTEHYEPAVGLYDPASADVASRLMNPPDSPMRTLLGLEECSWELLTKAQVEERLGYPVTELPPGKGWSNLDVGKVKQWVCIPATIQYTIWSDVYRCEGFVTIEEPTGKVSTRGKNAGKPIMRKRPVARGCGQEMSLWDVGLDHQTNEVRKIFYCPDCQQDWTSANAAFVRTEPTEIIYSWNGFKSNGRWQIGAIRYQRTLSRLDRERLSAIESSRIKHWYPKTGLVPGEQGNPFLSRGIDTVDRFWTPRNLSALAHLWSEFARITDRRLRSALHFLFTSVAIRLCSRMTMFNFGKRGNIALNSRLYLPHFQTETNVLKAIQSKADDVSSYYQAVRLQDTVLCLSSPAQELNAIPNASIDFIFTDPPFGRNIAYAEWNILWEAWLQKTTVVEKEAITSNGRKWGVESYAEKMRRAFKEMFRILKPGRYCLVEFNNGDPELGLFEIVKLAALSVGFSIKSMIILDKTQKSYNQVVGEIRGEDTVYRDVVFNLQRPSSVEKQVCAVDLDLEHQVAMVVREHLLALPERIEAEPAKYSDEYRTTATINSILMNMLIPRGVSVERLNLPFIERVCFRYFRKVSNRWYLRGEAVGGNGGNTLLEEEVSIKDELTAIAWLRQKLESRPMLIGELKPLWMRATGLLAPEVSQVLILDSLLIGNFWRDPDTNRWREPTAEERERMNDDRSLRVFHDAERFLAGTLNRPSTEDERCRWIDVLYQACRAVEDNDIDASPALRDFDKADVYSLITRLFQSLLKDHVTADVFRRAEKQYQAASNRIAIQVEKEKDSEKAKNDKQIPIEYGR